MHNLEAINAALRLGHKMIFPVGAVVTCYRRHSTAPCHTKILRVLYRSSRINRKLTLSYLTKRVEYVASSVPTIIVQASHIIEVISVPDDAPPFETWERY